MICKRSSFILAIVVVVGLLVGCDSGTPPKAQDPVTNLASLASVFPEPYANFPKKSGGACGFDQVKDDNESKFISGWAAISTKDGALPEAVVIGVSVNGSEKFIVASKQKRDDVAKYFNNPTLVDSGFSVYVNKAAATVGSKLTVYQVFQGVVYACEVSATL
jgi:hypothetical protein